MNFINNEKENTEDNSVLLRASLFKLIASVSKTREQEFNNAMGFSYKKIF